MAGKESLDPSAFHRALPGQMAVALLLLLGIFYGGYYYAPDGAIPAPQSGDFSTKILFTFRCFLFPGIFLWLAILKVGWDRIKLGALNPLGGNEHLIQLSKTRLMNTLEQTVIFIVQSVLLTTILEREEMKFVFLYTMVFVVGRIVFWIGYGINPLYRRYGTQMTLVSSVIVQALSSYLVCSRCLVLTWLSATTTAVLVPLGLLFLPEFIEPIFTILMQ